MRCLRIATPKILQTKRLRIAAPQTLQTQQIFTRSLFRWLRRTPKAAPVWRPRVSANDCHARMHAYIQFITTPTPDTPGTALLLHFDDKRYIFGQIHEGLQRASLESGTKFLKVKDIFVSGRTEWRNIGGLLGVVLTLADSTKNANTARSLHAQQRAQRRPQKTEPENAQVLLDPTLRVNGGRNLTHALATARSFIFRQGMPVRVKEFDDDPQPSSPFEDNRIRVWPMVIRPARSPRKRNLDDFMEHEQQVRHNVLREMFKSDWRYDALVETTLHAVDFPAQIYVRDPINKALQKYTGPTQGVPDQPVLVRQAWPGALVGDLPPTSPSIAAVSYIVKAHRQRGKFRTDLAKSYGLKPGREYSQLVEGHEVTAPDGRIITRDMVLDEGREGGGVAILDLPTREYLAGLVSRPEFADKDLMQRVESFIWILGPGVLEDPTLQEFMQKHAVHHVVSSSDVCQDRLPMVAAAKAHTHHRQIDPERYPPLQNARPTLVTKYTVAKDAMQIVLNPAFSLSQAQNMHSFDLAAVQQNLPADVVEEIKRLSHDRAEMLHADTVVTTLGTGSSAPSPCRNVSSTLIQVPGCGSYLLDCGEGTLGQIRRLFAPDEADAILRDLRLIWISHLHADHHLGTLSVIKAWADLVQTERLFIVGPDLMSRFLHEYGSIEQLGGGRLVPLSVRKGEPLALMSNGKDLYVLFPFNTLFMCIYGGLIVDT